MKVNRFYKRLFLSYLVFALTIILLYSYVNFGIVSDSARRMDEKYGVTDLNNSVSSINTMLMNIDSIMLEKCFDTDILKVDSNPHEYQKIQIISKIANAASIYPGLSSFYVTDFEKYVYMSNGYLDFNDFNDKDVALVYQEEKPGFQIWKPRVERSVYENYGSLENDVVTKYIPIKRGSSFLIANVTTSSIYNILQQNVDYDSKFAIFDQNGDFVVSSQDSEFRQHSNELYAAVQEDRLDGKRRGYLIGKMASDGFGISYCLSDYNGWLYLRATPLNTMYADTNAIRDTVVIALLISVIIGLLFSALLSHNIYKPVKRTVGRIDPKPAVGVKDEFYYINNAIDHFIRDKQVIESKYASNRHIVSEKLFHELLEGHVREDLELYREYLDVNVDLMLQGTLYSVILTVNYMNDLMPPISEAVYATQITCYNGRTVIWVQSESQLDSTVITGYYDRIGAGVLGIGSLARTLSGIAVSHQNAVAAMEYSIVEGDGVYWVDELCFCAEQDLVAEQFDDHVLVRFVMDRDQEGLLSLFENKIAPYLSKSSFEPNTIRSVYICVVNFFVRYMMEHHIPLTDSINARLASGSATIAEMKDTICELSQTVNEFLYDSDNRRIIEVMANYIASHYNEEITMDVLADKAFMSKGHLTRLFKRYYGQTLNKVLISKRLDVAKNLLITTKDTIGEISVSVGYQNTNSFTKIFKEHIGVTPNDYRRINACHKAERVEV